MTTKAQKWHKKCLNKGLPEEVSHILCTPRSWEAQALRPRATQSNYQIMRLYNKCIWWVTLAPFYKALGWEWLISQFKWLLIYDKWRRTQWVWSITNGQRQLHFGYNSCFGTSWLYHFLRRVDCIKFPQKLGQEISSIQFGSNAWSAHCSALDNMTLHKLQINRFEVEVESVFFPDFVLLARFSVDNKYGRDRLVCFSLSHTLKAIATPFSG